MARRRSSGHRKKGDWEEVPMARPRHTANGKPWCGSKISDYAILSKNCAFTPADRIIRDHDKLMSVFRTVTFNNRWRDYYD